MWEHLTSCLECSRRGLENRGRADRARLGRDHVEKQDLEEVDRRIVVVQVTDCVVQHRLHFVSWNSCSNTQVWEDCDTYLATKVEFDSSPRLEASRYCQTLDLGFFCLHVVLDF